MFKWIQTKKWLPDVLIGAIFALGLGIADNAIQGQNGLYASLLFGVAFFFFREYPYLGIAFVLLGGVATVFLAVAPTVAGFGVAFLVLLASAFGRRVWSLGLLASAIVSGLILAHYAAYQTTLSTQFLVSPSTTIPVGAGSSLS